MALPIIGGRQVTIKKKTVKPPPFDFGAKKAGGTVIGGRKVHKPAKKVDKLKPRNRNWRQAGPLVSGKAGYKAGMPAPPTPPKPPTGKKGGKASQGPAVSGGSATGAPNAAAGGGSGGGGGAGGISGRTVTASNATGGGSGGLDIEALYKPAYTALQALRDRDALAQAEAMKSLDSFKQFQAATQTSGQDFLKAQFQKSSEQTGQALQAALGAMQGVLDTGGTVNPGIAQQSGLTTALTGAGIRAGTAQGMIGAAQNQQSALANRDADNARVAAARAADMQMMLGNLAKSKAQGLDDRASQLDMAKIKDTISERQAARTAAIDQLTAEAVSGQKMAQLDLNERKFGLDKAKFNASLIEKDRNYQLAVKRLNKTSSGKVVGIKDVLKAGFDARKRAEKSWADQVKTTGKPFDRATQLRSYNDAVRKTAKLLATLSTDPQAVMDTLESVWGSATVRRAGL